MYFESVVIEYVRTLRHTRRAPYSSEFGPEYLAFGAVLAVIVLPCLKGSVLDCLTWTNMWLSEWELGSRAMSLQVRWTEGSNGPLQVNLLDLKNPKKARVKAAQSITWFRLWESSGLR